MSDQVPTPAEFPPLNKSELALLAKLARALMPTHGADATAAVERVSNQTRNVREIVTVLALDISDESKRAAFMRRAKDAVRTHREARKAAAPEAGGFSNRRTMELTPELMARAEQALAASVGKSAGVLVARYASSTDSSRDFFAQLSLHLRTPSERSMLFAAARAHHATTR